MPPISVLIVDDHPLMREALIAAIEADTELAVAGEAADGCEAVQRAADLHPDVIIMDLAMPGMDGIEAICAIIAQDPSAHIIVLTSLTEEWKALQAISAGAIGFLLKDASRTQILSGIRSVAQGVPFVSRETTGKLMHALQQPGQAQRESNAGVQPSARELDVLALLASGLTDAQVAVRLNISVATVRVHMHHLTERLHLADRSEAIAWYRRQYPQTKLR